MNRIDESDLTSILKNTQKVVYENMSKGSSIFITGATGFFGKWLLESFLYFNKELNLDLKICALSRNPDIFLEEFPFFRNEKDIKWIKGDIRTFSFPDGEFEYIIHAATDADAKLNSENPLLMLDTITEGSRRVLEFAKKQTNLKAFLLTSSGAVYGEQPLNVSHMKETDSFLIDTFNPKSAYAEGKRISELYSSIYAEQFSIPVKIARCFAFVGPYLPLDKHFAIGNFINNGLKGENIIIKSDGLSLRSYMYASDLIIWLLTILFSESCTGVFNVGSEKAYSIKDVASMVSGFFPGISVVVQNQYISTRTNYIPDVSKFKNKFSYRGEIGLELAIQKTISFYQKK